MKYLLYNKFRKNLIEYKKPLRHKLLNWCLLSLMVTSLLLMSCQSSQPRVRIVPASVARDLVFPVVPEIKANHASELTESEFQALIRYTLEAEAIFDIIDSREEYLEFGHSVNSDGR